MRRRAVADPFGVLGLERRADLTDDEVHAAWRRAAAAAHPDREDGGNPQRFAEAAAAYTALRTRFARGEVLADLQVRAPVPARVRWRRRVRGQSAGQPRAAGEPRAAAAGLLARVRLGRPVRLALRTMVAVAAGAVAVLAAGPHPAAPALVTGVATWLAVTARHDLAPPKRR